jgi:aspartyl-tRNA(Asn)/glutamyl-tRNA(Gln) amidotransferase subunit A
MNDLPELTIHEAREGLVQKKFSSKDLTLACLSRIKSLEEKVKAFITVTSETALKQAERVDKKIARGEKISPLAGIPVSIKDVFCTKGIRTTTGSKILENYIPVYDATVVARLKQNEAVILGKTNQDEFALGFTTETSAFRVTSNPWDLSRTPGGSGGGSAASVISGEVIYSLASEHCDSIRQPAAWCGIVGLKPTYGRASRFGIVAMASSLECPGPMTKCVKDAAIVAQVISGKDSHDATTAEIQVPNYERNLSAKIEGVKVGVPKEYFREEVEEEVKEKVYKAIKVFKVLKAKIKAIKLFPAEYSAAVYEVLYRAEVASNLSRYDGIRYGFRDKKTKGLMGQYYKTRDKFGLLLKRQILTDLRAIAGGNFDKIYEKALKVRRLVKEDFERVFKEVDVIIGPMSPCIAFKKGFYKLGAHQATDKTDKLRSLVDMYAEPPTLCGFPGISIPCGFSEGLPIGLQIFGPQFLEQIVLNVAFAYEQATNWHKIRPKL